MGEGKGTLAPGRTSWNLCLALTALNLSDTCDLHEKLALFAMELQVAQDSEQLSGTWRGCTNNELSQQLSDSTRVLLQGLLLHQCCLPNLMQIFTLTQNHLGKEILGGTAQSHHE